MKTIDHVALISRSKLSFPGQTAAKGQSLKRLLALTAGLLFAGALLTGAARAATILCVFRDRDPAEPGVQMRDYEDPPYLERLRNLGHTVILRGVSDADPNSPDHAQTSDVTPGIDAVFISGSVAASQIGDVYRYVPVPVIFSENAILDDLALSDDAAGQYANIFGAIAGQTNLVIVNPAHPMAAGLSGEVTVYQTPSQGRFNAALTNAHMLVIATAPNEPGRAVIFGYEKGACMYGITAPARRLSMFVPETDSTNWNANGQALFDAGITWALSAPSLPEIRLLPPANGGVFLPPGGGISFRASSAQPIDPSGIRLLLNGLDETPNLIISGDPTNRLATLSGLDSNRFYSGQVIVSNALGIATTSARFDTFSETAAVVVEAEDYNYGSGQFQNNPPPSGFDEGGTRVPADPALGYADQPGDALIDFSDTSSGSPAPAINAYRTLDNVGTRVLASTNLTTTATNYSDYPRSKFSGLPDYFVRAIGTNEWLNYTRNFSAGNYHVFLRAHSLSPLQINLDKVTSDPAQPDQTTAPLGTFMTGGCAECGFGYTPLTDGAGNLATLNLSGTNSLRLTAVSADVSLGLNYILFLPAGLSVAAAQPTIGSLAVNGNNLLLSFAARTGQRYSLEYKDSIGQAGWSTLGTFTGIDGLMTLTNPVPTGSQRYFRLATAGDVICQ